MLLSVLPVCFWFTWIYKEMLCLLYKNPQWVNYSQMVDLTFSNIFCWFYAEKSLASGHSSGISTSVTYFLWRHDNAHKLFVQYFTNERLLLCMVSKIISSDYFSWTKMLLAETVSLSQHPVPRDRDFKTIYYPNHILSGIGNLLTQQSIWCRKYFACAEASSQHCCQFFLAKDNWGLCNAATKYKNLSSIKIISSSGQFPGNSLPSITDFLSWNCGSIVYIFIFLLLFLPISKHCLVLNFFFQFSLTLTLSLPYAFSDYF